MEKLVYFDYAATTPVRPEAAEALIAALGQFGNPSSRYGYARQAAQRVREDRESVAQALGCSIEDIMEPEPQEGAEALEAQEKGPED